LPRTREGLFCKRESPFWFKNGTSRTPIPLFADGVKQFSYGPPRNASGTTRAPKADHCRT
jgi:hypothetical protein